MKVLVTGGCGFLGSHVCELFIKRGWEVIAYDNLTIHELSRTGYQVRDARDYNVLYLKGLGVHIVEGNVVNREAISDYSSGCSYIVHTAAQPAMTIAVEEPLLDFNANALGTFNVLEAARKHNIPVASCSTIHVYGTGINNQLEEGETRYTRYPAAIKEDHAILTGGLTPLHASKRTAEIYTLTYANTYKLKSAAFRYSGIYGPRQFGGEDHGWVANFAIRTVMGWPLYIFGSSKQVRDILYATDAAQAFWDYFQRPVPGIYNIGGGEDNMISLQECIELIESISGKKAGLVLEKERPGTLRYFVCDIEKARATFRFRPSVKPQEGVAKLLEWVHSVAHLFKST